MNVTKTERKESTKHCCGSGCRRRDSAEHKEEGGVEGMEVGELLQYLKANGEEIREAVLAAAQVLTPIYEPEFVEKSYGFRPGKSAHTSEDKIPKSGKAGNQSL